MSFLAHLRPRAVMTVVVLAVFVISVLTLTYAAIAPQHTVPPYRLSPSSWINYTTVTGVFLQDDADTDPKDFDYTTTNFGLIDRTYPTDDTCPGDTSWQRFGCYIDNLNYVSGKDVNFRLLFMGRHGEGWHNAAETYYGTTAWNCYYSKLDGNGTAVWADAHLDSTGIQQAEVAANFWASQIISQKIQTPQSYYVSPLFRALETSNITFSRLDLPSKYPFIPTIKELFRESLTGHTCDRRSNTTYIHKNFPSYQFEAAFAPEDSLWKPLLGETALDQDLRSREAVDDMFRSDSNTYISITSHSGEIASILRVLHHRPFSLNTGAVIPILVKVEKIEGKPAATSTESWTTLPTCSSPTTNTETSWSTTL